MILKQCVTTCYIASSGCHQYVNVFQQSLKKRIINIKFHYFCVVLKISIMTKAFLFIVTFLFLGINVFSQAVTAVPASQFDYSDGALEELLSGRNLAGLRMVHDSRLDSLFFLQKEVNQNNKGIKGYRVQMFRGNQQGESKNRAREIQGMVLNKFPELEVDVFYQPPFWRVQIGRFRMRNEAMKVQRVLKEEFREMESSISIVPTVIDYPKIVKKKDVDYQK